MQKERIVHGFRRVFHVRLDHFSSTDINVFFNYAIMHTLVFVLDTPVSASLLSMLVSTSFSTLNPFEKQRLTNFEHIHSGFLGQSRDLLKEG